MSESDPMIHGSDEERNAYAKNVMDTVKEAIEQDRADRRKPPRESQQATLIGGTGLPDSLIQSAR